MLYLVPYVIMELITMAIAVSKGYGSHLITAAGKMFLEHLLMYLLLYFGAVLALAIAGNILAGILSLCCVYLYGPVLGILLWVLEMMYFRTNMGLKEGMAEKISVFSFTCIYFRGIADLFRTKEFLDHYSGRDTASDCSGSMCISGIYKASS